MHDFLGRTGALFALAAAVPSFAGCVRTRVGALENALGPGPAAATTVTVDGTPHRLTQCRSGDHESFLGVDLSDDAGTIVLRLVIDPVDGPRLRLTRATAAGPETVRFSAGSCSALDARVEPTGWRVNEFRDLEGTLDANCAAESGPRLEAHVRFLHCH